MKRMKRTFALFLACALLLLPQTRALAHHSFSAEFDAAKPVKMTGAVTKVEWENPHVWFYIDVKSEDGAVTNWGLEMGSPNNLMRSGWNRNSLKIGDVVSVEGSRARDGTSHASASVVILTATGKRLFTAPSLGRPEAPPR